MCLYVYFISYVVCKCCITHICIYNSAYSDLTAFSFNIVSCIPFSLLPYGFNFLLTEEPHLAVLSVRDVFENVFTLALE